ncbi:MAG: agmatine deiminase family protein [bacterium]|nr:agmatine deiminase family protein [bacterium]
MATKTLRHEESESAAPITDHRSLNTVVPPVRLPAEFEPHAATWLAWPKNPTDWPGKIVPIYWVYAELARLLARSERVRIMVADTAHEQRARIVLQRAQADLAHISFVRGAYDRSWTRDFMPFFVRSGKRGDRALVQFRFNGWAKYRDFTHDQNIPPRVARLLQLPLRQARWQERPVVLEGGALDTNGAGTFLTTEECLLDQHTQVRNFGMRSADYETCLREYLGARTVIWLGRGIAGDDTHGHVDDLCRFVSRDTVVLVQEHNRNDVNYRALCENTERMQGARTADGARIQVVPLPMPAPLQYAGNRLPASYANFYMGTSLVLAPTFNDPNDRVALGLLAELFPTRTVVGVHAVDLVWGLGSVHCLTHEEPGDVCNA